jgi:hypothetical protein
VPVEVRAFGFECASVIVEPMSITASPRRQQRRSALCAGAATLALAGLAACSASASLTPAPLGGASSAKTSQTSTPPGEAASPVTAASSAAASTQAAASAGDCGPNTIALYNPRDTSPGAIDPATTSHESGAPTASGALNALSTHGIPDQGQISQYYIAALTGHGKVGVLCPNGNLYITGQSQPVLTDAGLVTRSYAGQRIPVNYSLGYYWHRAADVLGNRPALAFVLVVGPVVEAVDANNLDAVIARPTRP